MQGGQRQSGTGLGVMVGVRLARALQSRGTTELGVVVGVRVTLGWGSWWGQV